MLTYLRNIIALLCIVLFLNLQKSYAQEELLNQQITVSYSNTPLEEALDDIHAKTGIEFSYSPQRIPLDFLVNFSATDRTYNILTEICNQAGIEFSLTGGHLILQKTDPRTEDTRIETKIAKYTISGTIQDQRTGEVLIGAAIYIKETGRGTLSNQYGFFSLTLPKGKYNLEASYLGHTTIPVTVELTKNTTWNPRLADRLSMMEEVVISSVNKEQIVFNILSGQSSLDAVKVEQQNAALGETDMLKSLANIPGISFQNDGSSYFHVRGGARDQNLILLDEAPIYNPSHLLGLFTPIIPEAVKKTEVYKADIPIQYGGRLSSVIDIRTKDGNIEHFSGSGNLGLVSTRLNFEGPIRKKRSSYFISFRRSQLGMYLKKSRPSIEDFYFNDFTTKMNFKLGKNDRIFLTLYSGKDIFLINNKASKSGLEWGNNSLTLRWNHIFGNRLFSNTTLYTSKYDYFLYTDYDAQLYWNSHISSANIKSEYTFFLSPTLKTLFGINIGGYFFNPGNYSSPEIGINNTVSQANSSEFVLYGGNEHQISSRLKLNYGIRMVSWADFGEAFTVVYNDSYEPNGYKEYAKGEEYYSNLAFEPRIALSVRTGDLSSLKFSYNQTIQNIHLINNSISPLNSLEVWLPSGPNIKPQHAQILNLGYVQNFMKKKLDFQADLFVKRMYNQIGYAYHAEVILNPYIEGELRQGDGLAYGFELLLKKSIGKIYGHLGYAYTRSFLKIKGLNYNKAYPAHQDKPIDFSMSLGYQIKPRWNINSNLAISSGMRISTPTGFYAYQGAQVPVYTKQNNQLLATYKRFDLGTTIRLNKIEGKTEHYLNLALYNFFNIKNAAFLSFNKTANDEGKIVVPADKLADEELTPTFRYIYSIVPSINYSLKF